MSEGRFVDFSRVWILMKFLQPYLHLLVTYLDFNSCKGELLCNLCVKQGPLGEKQQTGWFKP